MKGYDHIVWDFNGTILDDVGIGIECVNILLERYGHPIIKDRETYYRLFGFPIEDYYRRVGFDFSVTPYEMLAHEWVAEYRAREDTAPIRDGALELIRYFSVKGIPQTVISATKETMLREQIEKLGILPYFEETVGRGDIYAADKSALAVDWRKRRMPGRTLMIGDTEHDYETARAAGFDIVLLEGGHQPREQLMLCGCPVLSGFSALTEWLHD